MFRHQGFADAQPEYDFGSIATTWGQIVTRLKEVVENGGTAEPGAFLNDQVVMEAALRATGG